MIYFDRQYLRERQLRKSGVSGRTLDTLRRDAGELEQAANELLMFVAHLEVIEHRREQRLPFTTATNRR